MKLSWPIKNVSLVEPIVKTGGEIYVSQWFGEKKIDYSQYGMKHHDGVDVSAPKGTEVLAMHDGWVVESIAKDTGYGIRVQVYFEEDGFGWLTIYGHFDSSKYQDIPYNLQDRRFFVKRGQAIGYVDSTGNSTGNHLHFGLRRLKNGVIQNYNNGTFGWIDPKPFLTINLIPESMKLYIDRRTTPPTIVPGLPVDKADNLKWFASQNGYELPLLPNGDIDWSKIVYDGEIK